MNHFTIDGKAFQIAPQNASDLFQKLKDLLKTDIATFSSKEKSISKASYAFIFEEKSRSPDLGIVSFDNETTKLDVLFLQAKRITANSNIGISLKKVEEEHKKYVEMISNTNLVRNGTKI